MSESLINSGDDDGDIGDVDEAEIVASSRNIMLTIGYDGLMLMVATTFADYPLEKPMLALTLANPVDLARTMIVLQSDAAALMGYTGALMHRYLGSMLGSLAAIAGLLLWILSPVWAGRRAFERRDF